MLALERGLTLGLLHTSRDSADSSSHRKEQSAWARLLGAGEQVQHVFRLGRSTLVFTNRRLVVVDEALTGRQVEYTSVPYRALSHYSVEAAGPFSTEADLRLWVIGRTTPIERQFPSDIDVYEVQALLAQHLAP